jgi:hypothetical protein
MKRIITMLVGLLILIAMLNSCKEVDERDKYAGTWTGLMIFSRIGYEFSTKGDLGTWHRHLVKQ